MSKAITAETTAWLPDHEPLEALRRDPTKIMDALAFYSGDMTKNGWTRVGAAKIEVELPDDDELIGNKIASLREELKTVRAEAEVRAGRIEEKIRNLLAIEYKPAGLT